MDLPFRTTCIWLDPHGLSADPPRLRRMSPMMVRTGCRTAGLVADWNKYINYEWIPMSRCRYAGILVDLGWGTAFLTGKEMLSVAAADTRHRRDFYGGWDSHLEVAGLTLWVYNLLKLSPSLSYLQWFSISWPDLQIERSATRPIIGGRLPKYNFKYVGSKN